MNIWEVLYEEPGDYYKCYAKYGSFLETWEQLKKDPGKNITNTIIASTQSITLDGELRFLGAFENTSLVEIKIPDTMKTIAVNTFRQANDLEKIIFHGSYKEWEAIEKGLYWDFGADKYSVYCTDGIFKRKPYKFVRVKFPGTDKLYSYLWVDDIPIDINDTVCVYTPHGVKKVKVEDINFVQPENMDYRIKWKYAFPIKL